MFNNYDNLKKQKTRILNTNDVQDLLSMDETLDITETAYKQIALEEIVCPSKISLSLPENSKDTKAWINAMPALLKNENIVGQKWVSVLSNNKNKQLPTTIGTIILNDAVTGLPLAIIDGTYITHLRTGASVAIGAKYLALNNCKNITVIGAGNEASTIIVAMKKLFPIEKISVVGRTLDSAKKFTSHMKYVVPAEYVAFDNAQEAIQDSKIIILATTASIPVIMYEWLKPGDFVCGLSGIRDMDKNIATKSTKLVFDNAESGMKRIIDLSGESLYGHKAYDLCHIIAKTDTNGWRENLTDIIAYLPLGLAGVDVALAHYVYKKSLGVNIGDKVALF